MIQVVLAFTDVGLAVALQAALEGAAFEVIWRAELARGPGNMCLVPPEVVVLDLDRAGPVLDDAVAAWRALEPPPALLGVLADPRAAPHATALRLPTVAASADGATLRAALADATRLRFTAALSPSLAGHALDLPADADEDALIVGGRAVDVELVHAALRWHALDYVTGLRGGDARLRDLLTGPEQAQLAHVGGHRTVQSVVRAGPLDGISAARLLWTLGSIGAIAFSPAPLDRSIPARRRVAELRDHLAARSQRLAQRTFYDVLEVSPLADAVELERAYRLLRWRYGPEATAAVDLGDHAALIEPSWAQIERAHQVLTDDAARGRYNEWLRPRLRDLRTTWALDSASVRAAAEAYARGHQAQTAGEPHRALSELATAARCHPGHPDYETGLAWARYRVEVAAGRGVPELARRERVIAEAAMAGGRPWPRALVTVALLCAAEAEPDGARWYLREALAIEPGSTGARALLARLGG